MAPIVINEYQEIGTVIKLNSTYPPIPPIPPIPDIPPEITDIHYTIGKEKLLIPDGNPASGAFLKVLL